MDEVRAPVLIYGHLNWSVNIILGTPARVRNLIEFPFFEGAGKGRKVFGRFETINSNKSCYSVVNRPKLASSSLACWFLENLGKLGDKGIMTLFAQKGFPIRRFKSESISNEYDKWLPHGRKMAKPLSTLSSWKSLRIDL